jgi:hypothetical protein
MTGGSSCRCGRPCIARPPARPAAPHPTRPLRTWLARRSPDCHPRDLRTRGHLSLASGDGDGGVMVWDVSTASVLARLEDCAAAREVLR